MMAALIVAAGFLGSRVLGLLRSVIIANTFGTQPELDAYWVAFRLPDLVFQLLAGATLASAFIPTFARVLNNRGDAEAWRLASSVLNLVFLATLIFAGLAFVLAPQLVPLLAPGLGENTGREAELQDLAVRLTRIMLLSPVLFAVSGMFMGILNARRRFLMPALAPMLYNLAIIVAALISHDIRVLAAGVVAGAGLHLLVQLPDLAGAGMRYGFVARWRDAAVREVASLMAPRVVGLAAVQISFHFSAVFFASQLSSGAISAASFAWLILMTPLGVIGLSISTAAFPTLAEQASRNDPGFGPTLSGSLRLILYLSLPLSAGLMLLAQPLIVVLFQRGAFDVESSRLTAQALIYYAPALASYSAIEILSRGFYALGDTRTPVALSVAAMLINFALTAALTATLELRGLGIAASITGLLESAVLLALLSRRVPSLLDGAARDGLKRMLAATLLLGASVVASLLLLERVLGLEAEASAGALAVLAVSALAGGLAYAGASLLFGIAELPMLLQRLPVLRRFAGA